MGRGVRAAVVLLLAATAVSPVTAAETYNLCTHVSITGPAPIPRHADRFGQFYFDYVNAELGGVDGHPVAYRAYDDGYNPAGARRAAEQCIRDDGKLLVGSYGPNQTASLSTWAESRGFPYLRVGGPLAGFEDREWTAFIGPTDEEQMIAMATAIATEDQAPRVGIVRINSPYYDPGRDAFEAALAERGVELLADIPVQTDENNFASVWYEIADAQLDVVNLYVTPHLFARMMTQRPTTVDPTIVSIATLLGATFTAAAAGDATVVTFHEPAPAYDPDDETLPWHEEILEFQRIFASYSPEQDPAPDDLDWLSYLRAKQVHRFLDALDEDLSHEHVQSMFSTYAEEEAAAFPTCALDFTASPRLGAHAWHVFGLDAGRWRQTGFCVDGLSLDLDLSAPRISCDGGPYALEAVRCRFEDDGAGIGSYLITDEGTPFSAGPLEGHGDCAAAAEVSVPLPPGLHRIRVTVANCSGTQRVSEHTYVSLAI